MLTITMDTIREMDALVESGDLNLAERREVYAAQTGHECPLDDVRLKIAVAATDDDDDELFAKNVDIIASGQYLIQ